MPEDDSYINNKIKYHITLQAFSFEGHRSHQSNDDDECHYVKQIVMAHSLASFPFISLDRRR